MMATVNETFYRVYGTSRYAWDGAEPDMIWRNYVCQEILRENHLHRKESLISFGVNRAAHVHPSKLTHKKSLPKTEV